MHFLLDGGPSRSIRIGIEEANLIHMSDPDRNFVISIRHHSGDKLRPLGHLSRQFKNALLAVAGPCAMEQLGFNVSTSSGSRSSLKLAHLPDPITFVLTHVSELPPDTQRMSSQCKTGDRIVYDRTDGSPFLQSDFKASKPKGALDFAVALYARDLVWVDSNLCLASQPYRWECQYMAELRSDVLNRLLYDQPLPGLMSHMTYKDAGIKYQATSNAPFHALEAIAGEASNTEVKLLGRPASLIRPGCGVVVDVPVAYTAEHSKVDRAFGSVIGFETRAGVDFIVIRVHLCGENVPCSLLSRMSPGELIQTNITVTVRADWVSGTYRISPPLLYTATHITEVSDDESISDFKDKIVVCDALIGQPVDTQHPDLGVLAMVASGQVPITLRRMDPFPPECALAFLHHQHAVHSGGLYPPAIWYRPHLADILKSFARQKTAQHLKSSKDMLTMHPRIPGAALMELLYLKMDASRREVSISNGNILVKVVDLEFLQDVFGIPVADKFNFIPEGFGMVKLDGPFVFKWSMYDTLEQTGPLDGSVSISVGSYTEYDRMGSGALKSSKCHPDSIKAQSHKSKRLRDGIADSENQRPEQPSSSALKRASLEAKLLQSMQQRVDRAMKRLGVEDWAASLRPDETPVTKPSQSVPEDCFIVESDQGSSGTVLNHGAAGFLPGVKDAKHGLLQARN